MTGVGRSGFGCQVTYHRDGIQGRRSPLVVESWLDEFGGTCMQRSPEAGAPGVLRGAQSLKESRNRPLRHMWSLISRKVVASRRGLGGVRAGAGGRAGARGGGRAGGAGA